MNWKSALPRWNRKPVTVKRRIARLEQKLGPLNGKHYLHVWVAEGENPDTAIARAAEARGITLTDLGLVDLIIDGSGCETRGYGHHNGRETLIGWPEFLRQLEAWLAEIDGAGTGIETNPMKAGVPRKAHG